jgi:hypothetical protein
VIDKNQHKPIRQSEKKALFSHCPLVLSSEESLQIVAKDSLEDLHTSSVCVSDKSPVRATNEVKDARGTHVSITSPKKLHKKSLTLKIDGADFEMERKKRRPLSPFDSVGALRRIMSPSPLSAPATVTEFRLTVAEEVHTQLAREKGCRKLEKLQVTNVGPAQVERGGKTLLGFLEKKIGRAE